MRTNDIKSTKDLRMRIGTDLACDGLTVREYFAAMAMQGLLIANNVSPRDISFNGGKVDPKELAASAFEMADDMLNASCIDSAEPLEE